MDFSLLHIYSTAMWKKYTTPISKSIATYSVGVTEMAMSVYCIAVCVIAIFFGAGLVPCLIMFVPWFLQVLYMMFIFRLNGKLDSVLEYEQMGRNQNAIELSDLIRRRVNVSTAVTVIAIALLACFILFFDS